MDIVVIEYNLFMVILFILDNFIKEYVKFFFFKLFKESKMEVRKF